MFHVPKRGVIESDSGFSVEEKTFPLHELVYREGDRCLRIGFEYAAEVRMFVYIDYVHCWEPPHEAESVTEADRLRIMQQIRAAYLSQGDEVDFFRRKEPVDRVKAQRTAAEYLARYRRFREQ